MVLSPPSSDNPFRNDTRRFLPLLFAHPSDQTAPTASCIRFTPRAFVSRSRGTQEPSSQRRRSHVQVFRHCFEGSNQVDSNPMRIQLDWNNRPDTCGSPRTNPSREVELEADTRRCGTEMDASDVDEARLQDEGDGWEDAGSADETSDLQREWKTRRDRFYVHGFREGLDEGKEQTLQRGFNEGFSTGSRTGFRLGFSQGVYEALVKLDEAGLHKLTEKEKEYIGAIDNLPPSRVSHKEVLATGDVKVSAVRPVEVG